MPQGVERGAEIDLTDRTYDGQEEDGHLSGGLGQLFDGQEGPDNFRLDLNGNGKGMFLSSGIIYNSRLKTEGLAELELSNANWCKRQSIYIPMCATSLLSEFLNCRAMHA